jgi:putative heme-binding domain-containing protein
MSNAARLALDRHPVADVRVRALAEHDPATIVDAWTYLATRGAPADREAGVAMLLAAAIESQKVQAAALRAVALTILRQGTVDSSQTLPILAQLQAVDDPDVRYHAAKIATTLGGVKPEWLLEQLETSDGEQSLRWALLSRLHEGDWSPAQELHYLRWLRRHQDVIGGHSAAGFVRAFEARFMRDMDDDHRVTLLALLDADDKPLPQRPTRPHVEYWTADLLGAALPDVKPGREDWGEELFFEARCADCHRFRGRGGSAGPDLTGVGGRMSETDLLIAIVDPNRDVTDQYAPTWVETEDGLYTGRVLDLDDERIVLDVDPYGTVETMSIARSNILDIELSDVSTMPMGLLNGFTPGEVKALLNWLRR